MADNGAYRGVGVKLEGHSRSGGGCGMVEQTGNFSGHRGAIWGGGMSVTQTLIGGGIAVLALNALASLVLPDATGIHVNSLTYEAGMVTQDRTVVGRGDDFYAQWAALVVDAETGMVVPGCSGDGAAPYQPGRKAVTFPLSDWVGNAACTDDKLVAGRAYELRAVWSWGEESVSATAGFVK